MEASEIKLFYEIYGEPIPSIRGKTTADKGANMKDTYDPGLKLQITEQSLTTDIMHVSGVKFVVSLAEPLNIIISSYVPSLGQGTLGRALKGHLDCLEMFGFHARMTRVDPLKALATLRGRFQGVEIDISGAGDHLPVVDIRIRRIKELARSTIESLKFDMPTSLMRYLITYCVSRINVMTGTSGGNVSPRVKLTGRKVNYTKEFALKFGDYVEARNPEVVSNSMQPRTQACIALYPTTSLNGAWKMLNLVSKMIVSRTTFHKVKDNPDYIIQVMNELAKSGTIRQEDIEGINPGVHIGNEDLMPEEFVEEEPQTAKLAPDPNVIEILGANDESMREERLGEEAVDEKDEPIINTPAEAGRRSTRSTAGTTTRYEDYVRPDGVSGLTTKWGVALANLRVKVALETFGDKAHDAIADELTSLFIKKESIKSHQVE